MKILFFKFIFFNIIINLLIFYVKTEDDVTNTFFKFESCEASSTFPSIGENGLPEYGAENALTKGSGYWCSEGKHTANDVVFWTGHLKNARSLNGIIIHWAYCPGEVAVFASFDGNEPYEEVTPFQVIESRSGNIVQNIIFNHVIRAKSIRLHMRYALHEYFGINFVHVLGSRDPTLRIQSGMTSLTQDLCLQVDETFEVVLEGCINSFAYLDGRDLWKLNAKNQIYNPVFNLCITLKDNLVANGGKIIVDDCNASIEHNDGRSVWQLLPNNQLKLLREGNFCLSQEGSKSGSIDVALNKEASSTLSKADKNFAPTKALDGNLDSFWVSQGFNIETAPDAVFFDVNLGSKFKIQKILIDWKFPATKFSILVSKDGENFNEVSSNLANFLRSTINNLHNIEAQFIRLKLITPNTEYAENDELFYGIKKFSVYTNRIKSIVDDCDKIKDSDDARDKYFFEFVSEVHLQEGNELKRLDKELQQFAEKIQSEGIKIQQLNPELKKCKNEKEKRFNLIKNIKNVILKNIYDVILETQNVIKANPLSYFSTSTSELGQTPENPADNCFHLKKTLPHLVSGFYYILPSCAQNVLRVFCDMKFGATYFVPIIDTKLISELKDVENICSTYGLNPIHIHHENQVHSLKQLFQIININISNPVPLAIRKETENFFTLDFQENIHNIVTKFGTPVGNTFGINNEGVIFFDSSSSEMSAFVCSDNIDFINVPDSFVNLNCTSTLKESNEFNKVIGNEFLIKCPHDCLERDIEANVIGGEGNIYSETSSICLSAIHAGVFDKHLLIHLRIINAPNEFEGIFQNGIISESFVNDDQEIAFKLFSVPQSCPGLSHTHDFSFLERSDVSQNKDLSNDDNTNLFSDEITYVDPTTADAINDLITIVNKQIGSTDPTFLGLINKQVIKIVSNARRYLKPTENFEKNIELLSNETLKDVQKVSHVIKLLGSKINSEIDKAKYKLETLIDERLRQTEFESWRLEGKEEPIEKIFEIVNSVQLQHPGNWKISQTPLEEGFTGISLIQTVRVVNKQGINSPFTGTFAFLKHKSFFDFVFSTHVHVRGVGSIGLIFRAHDKFNFYLFEISNVGNGFKRLLKFENNKATEIAIINQSDFDEGVWHAIRIECRASKIKITVIKTNNQIFDLPDPDIIVSDDFNTFGTIGFFTHGVNSVNFTRPIVESIDCLTKDTILHFALHPFKCNIYEEFFTSSLNKTYTIIDPENASNGPSNWNFTNNYENEKRVLLQTSNIKSNINEIPSICILQNKICETGIIKFSFFPKCSDGLVGAVFKFLDNNNYTLLEISSTFTRLRQNINGNFQILGKSIISGFKQNTWNKVTISFSINHINVNIGSGLTIYPILSLINLNLQNGNKIGFTTFNCNVAFSNIFLHPLDFKSYSPIPDIKTETFIPVSEVTKEIEGEKKEKPETKNIETIEKEVSIEKHAHELTENIKKDINFCATHKNIVDRLKFCNEHAKDKENCENNFCTNCCNLIDLNSEEKLKCEELCTKLDEHVIKSSEVLNFLKKSCLDNLDDDLRDSCKDYEDPEKCITEMCQLCCQSVKIPSNLTKDVNVNLLIDFCVSIC